MNKKSRDDDEEETPISEAEIARLRAAHERMKAMREQTAKEESGEEAELRERLGDENFENYMKRRAAYEQAELRRRGIKPPQQKSEAGRAAEITAQLPAPQIAPPRIDFPEIMTVEQVAEYLQLHPQVVYRHIRHGTIPVCRIGRTARVKKSILDQFLDSGAWSSVNEYLRYLKSQGQLPAGAMTQKQQEMEPPRRQRFSVDVD